MNWFHYYKQLDKTQWLPEKEIKRIQLKKLKKLVNYSYFNVDYYHRMFKENNINPTDIKDIQDIKKIPVLKKNVIRENFPLKITSKCIDKKFWIYNYTSGSTGKPLQYYTSYDAMQMRKANKFRNYFWSDFDSRVDSHAIIWGFIDKPSIRKGGVFQNISNLVGNFLTSLENYPSLTVKVSIENLKNKLAYHNNPRRVLINAFDLKKENIQKYFKILTKQNPKIIRSYVSSLILFPKVMKNNNQLFPKSIICSGETLTAADRTMVENFFNCKVFNCYGCREFSHIAYECNQFNGFHINDEDLLVEIIKNNENVASSEIGEIIITDLNNYIMPFLRYKIEDVGTVTDEHCNCGRGLTLIKSLLGRTPDVIVTKNNKFLIIHFFTLLFQNLDGVEQFQIIQEKIDEIKVKLKVNNKYNKETEELIIHKIENYSEKTMKIEIEIVDSITLEKSGKYRFIKSEIAKNYL